MFLAFIIIGCLIYPQFISCHDPVVAIENGKLRGISGQNLDGQKFYQFLGIPYAKPPVNLLRFQLPQLMDPWKGIKNATKPGDTCISMDNFALNTSSSENCLYLNIFTRNLPHSKAHLKPVMVYLHGGGLTYGSATPDAYGPEFLMLKDVVLVTLNYRLGILGFLSSSDPSLNLPGNLGLKDQLFALKWIRRNIEKFNGNPDCVTLFGNSAGSSSIHAHILSGQSKGWFHRAILQSGSVLSPDFWGQKDNAREVISKLGKFADSEKEAVEIIKQLPAEKVFEAQQMIEDSPYPADRRPFCAVQEYPNPSAIISQSPVKTLKEGAYNRVPIMMGYTNLEGMFLDLVDGAGEKIGLNLSDSDLEKLIPFNMDVAKNSEAVKEIVAKLKDLYKGKPFEDRYDPVTDSVLLAPIIEGLRLHLNTTTAKPTIFLYRMSLATELNQLKRFMNRTSEPGATHTDELGYLFKSVITPQIIPGSVEDEYLRKFVDLWTNFASYGDPNGAVLKVKWEPVESENNIRVLEIGNDLIMKTIPEKRRLQVWWDIFRKYPLIKF